VSQDAFLYVYPSDPAAYPPGGTFTKTAPTQNANLNSLFQDYGVTDYRLAFPGAPSDVFFYGAHELYFTGDPDALIAELNATGLFSAVEKEYLWQTNEVISTDESFGNSTCANPISVNDPNADWAIQAVDAPCAWSIAQGSSSIPVALVDTEIDENHPDLTYPSGQSKIVSIWFDTYWNTNPYPACNHGTKVASMIAAQPDNGVFGAGTGFNTSIAAYIPRNGSFSGGGCFISPGSGVWQAAQDGRGLST